MQTHYRPSQERGGADHGWLNAKHTFSFADYYDPNYMGFRSLRVINEDRIQPTEGFPTHGHKDMEIVTYVISGALEHKDSMGNGSIIHPGEFQYMSAGSGVRHSEFNHSNTEVTHLLQIWILPDRARYAPRYDQKKFPVEYRQNQLFLAVQGEGYSTGAEAHGNIIIRQDARIYTCLLDARKSVSHATTERRGLWLQLVQGELEVANHKLKNGDGLAIENASQIQIRALQNSEFLLFDLA